MNSGKYVFALFLSFVDRYEFRKYVERYGRSTARKAAGRTGSIDGHLKKVSEENRETTKSVSPVHVPAPAQELKRMEKHHRNLRVSPVRPPVHPTKKHSCPATRRTKAP